MQKRFIRGNQSSNHLGSGSGQVAASNAGYINISATRAKSGLKGKAVKDYGVGRSCPGCGAPMSRYNPYNVCEVCHVQGISDMIASVPDFEEEDHE